MMKRSNQAPRCASAIQVVRPCNQMAETQPQLRLKETGRNHTMMASVLRRPIAASSLFHQLLLLDLIVAPTQRKIARRLRVLTQIARS